MLLAGALFSFGLTAVFAPSVSAYGTEPWDPSNFWATTGAKYRVGFATSGATVPETRQGSYTEPVRIQGYPGEYGVQFNLEIVDAESTATRDVDYQVTGPLACEATSDTWKMCHIPLRPLYTADCELDETVVFRLSLNVDYDDDLDGSVVDDDDDAITIDSSRSKFTVTIEETLDDGARAGSSYAQRRCTADGVDWKRNNTPLNGGGKDSTVVPEHGNSDGDAVQEGTSDVTADDEDVPLPCDAAVAIDRARAAFKWHMSYGSNAAMFWRILNTLGADDLPAKPPGVTHETITAQEASDFSSGNGWAGWPPINDALQRCTTAPDPVTPDPDPVPEPEPEPVTPDPEPDPEVSVAAGGGVTEGGDAVFTVTAVPAPSVPLSVDVSVSQSGDFGAATGPRTVTVATSGTATLTVTTTNDSADEADGKVTVTVGAGSGYTVSPTAGSASVAVADDDDPPPPPPPPVNATPSLSISDATAGEGGTLTFTVTLSPASSRYAWVNYYARPEHGAALSATYADFAQAYGMLTFKPGETSKTITVAAVDDSSPESDETFKVVLYSAVQAAIADGEATGTITDND